MQIIIKHFDGQYPSFNVALSSQAGKDPFIEIKGCRIASGSNGDFVSWPSRKQDNGKYWNHVYASDAFNAAVLKEARKSAPKPMKEHAAPASGFSDMEQDPPF